MKTFKIGQEIRDIILSSSAVKEMVNVKVFPLIAPANTTFPFIIYRRNGYQPNNNKDGKDEMVFMETTIVVDKYEDSVKIANNVADTLRTSRTENIDEINITNTFEEFTGDSYIQKINISVILK